MRRIAKQGTLLLVTVLTAAALQSWAFSEPAATPPSGDAFAPLNTGPNTQDKRDTAASAAWITADGVGSRYGAILASISGNMGIGTTDPAVKVDVNGEIRPGNTGIACASAITGALRWNAGYVEACDGTNWRQIVYNTTCPTVQNGTVGAYPTCTITCNSGYQLSNGQCVATTEEIFINPIHTGSGWAGRGGGTGDAALCAARQYDYPTQTCASRASGSPDVSAATAQKFCSEKGYPNYQIQATQTGAWQAGSYWSGSAWSRADMLGWGGYCGNEYDACITLITKVRCYK